MFRNLSLALLASAAILPSTVHAEIGSVAAVNRDLDGTPPAGEKRALQLGNRVVTDELIQTSPIGSGQLMFLDQTTLTVAPGSNIVLDEYVYNPNSQSGDMALSITRGTLRIIGGRITKKTEAIITTPTATVGIRGGLAIVSVDENGDTTVILIAGEYARVLGPDGRTTYLSRPNAWAEITGQGGTQYAGLVPREVLEELYKKLEGKGNGGNPAAATAAALAAVQKYVEKLDNANEEGGERRRPVSTSGESPEDDRGEGDTEQGEGIFDDLDDPLASNPPGEPEVPPIEPPIEPPVDPGVVIPGGGAFASASTGFTGFDVTGAGSIIGFNSGNIVVEAVFPNVDVDTLNPSFGFNETTFFAQEGNFGAGFFEFDFITDDSPVIEENIVLETETFFGPNDILPGLEGGVQNLDYFGFIDPNELFFLAQFRAEFGGSTDDFERGQFFFGDPSPNQAILGPDLAQADTTANTAGGYVIEPNLRDFGLNLPGEHLLIIANGGEARFLGTGDFNTSALQSSSSGPGLPSGGPNTDPTQDPVSGGLASNVVVVPAPGTGGPGGIIIANAASTPLDLIEANGGRVLSGEVDIQEFGSTSASFQESEFQVFAQPIAESGSGGLSFGGRSFGTFKDGEGFGYRIQNFGTLEDNDGNTVFGSQDNYLIVSSFFREDGLPANDYQNDPGTTTFFFDPPFSNDNDLSQNLLTKDPTLDAIVTNPLPLVEAEAAGFQDSNDAFIDNDRFAVFNAGLTFCSDGNCGTAISDTPFFSGVYGQRTQVNAVGDLIFASDNTGFDDNGLFFRFRTQPTALTRIPGTNEEERASFTYGVGIETSDSSGAYLNDDVFGFSEGGVETSTGDRRGGGTDVLSDFTLGSSGLVGTAGLVDDADQPSFLRWGFWSARYDITPDREDLTHMGTFAAGSLPEIANLPTDGSAFYSGIAVGSDVNPNAGFQNLSGTFSLSYNFETRQGNFDLDFAGFSFDNAFTRGLTSDPRLYSVRDDRDFSTLRADGAFVASGQIPNAGTIGSFEIIDRDIPTREIVGVFGGDIVSE